MAALIAAVQHVLPEGVFTVLSERTGWGGRGPDTAIIILTPDRAFLNDRPWISSSLKSSQKAMVAVVIAAAVFRGRRGQLTKRNK